MIWFLLDPRYRLEDAIGLLPAFVRESDPRSAIEQFAERYCGGWLDSKIGARGFRVFDDFRKLHFPGDPPLHALAETSLPATDQRGLERIIVYESAFVAVVQNDHSFRVARLD